MNRTVLSLLIGALPTTALLFAVQNERGNAGPQTDTGAVPEVPALAPPEPATTPSRDAWLTARGHSPGESLRYLEHLDAAAVRALLTQVDTGDAGFGQVFDRFAELDLAGALAFAEGAWPQEKRAGNISATLRRWATEDIDACWTWIEQNPPPDSLLTRIFEDRAFAMPTPDEIARTWGELERCSAAIDGEKIGGSIMPRGGVFFHPVTKRPSGSLFTLVHAARDNREWPVTLERMLDLPHCNTPVLYQVAHDWMAHDMDAAVRWALAIDDPRQRDLVFLAMTPSQYLGPGTGARFDKSVYFRKLVELAPDRAVSSLGDFDPVQTSRWLADTLDGGAENDKARQSLSRALIGRDITAAISWAETIVDKKIRDRAKTGIALEWARHEPWHAIDFAQRELGWSREKAEERLRRRN